MSEFMDDLERHRTQLEMEMLREELDWSRRQRLLAIERVAMLEAEVARLRLMLEGKSE